MHFLEPNIWNIEVFDYDVERYLVFDSVYTVRSSFIKRSKLSIDLFETQMILIWIKMTCMESTWIAWTIVHCIISKIYTPGPHADLGIELFILKLVHTENFTVFGLSRHELRYFENFVFPIHLT
jgi:hypothetical protein